MPFDGAAGEDQNRRNMAAGMPKNTVLIDRWREQDV
jgi:hypothetical protein